MIVDHDHGLRGRHTVVLGLGLTGLSLVRHLVRHGAHVRVADTRAAPPNAEALAREHPQVRLECGPLSEATFAGAELIAISPGVPKDQAPIAAAVGAGAELVGDVELFARALPVGQKVLAITGTNGKTTVTSLTGALVAAAGMTSVVAGNIGAAVLDVLAGYEAGAAWPEAFVLELSSYQLETTHSLETAASAVLNVSANHLDRYPGLADYAAAKARIYAHAGVQVLNRDDPIVRLMRLPGHVAQTFGASVPLSEEEWGLVRRADGEWLARGGELLLPAASLALVGRHNALNALAALALVASVAKVTPAVLAATADFRGLPHRMERVADVGGVLYVNDSKGTTVAATEAALAGLARPVILIAGGDGKGQSFVPLKATVARACKAVLLIGRDAPLVARGLAGIHCPIEEVGTLERAVARAGELAQPGDAVVLSPACASLDQFASYIERGERFTALVTRHLAEGRCAST